MNKIANVLEKVNQYIPVSKIADLAGQALKGPGGIQTNGLKDIGSSIAGNLISKIPGLSEANKDALKGIKDQIASRIETPTGQTVGSLITKPTVAAPSAKPDVAAPSNKPKWTFDKLSGWDKFKNWISGAGNEDRSQGEGLLGLKTHQITDQDYLVDPKTGKSEFSWDQARKNDAERGRAVKTEFNPGALIGLGTKVISSL